MATKELNTYKAMAQSNEASLDNNLMIDEEGDENEPITNEDVENMM